MAIPKKTPDKNRNLAVPKVTVPKIAVPKITVPKIVVPKMEIKSASGLSLPAIPAVSSLLNTPKVAQFDSSELTGNLIVQDITTAETFSVKSEIFEEGYAIRNMSTEEYLPGSAVTTQSIFNPLPELKLESFGERATSNLNLNLDNPFQFKAFDTSNIIPQVAPPFKFNMQEIEENVLRSKIEDIVTGDSYTIEGLSYRSQMTQADSVRATPAPQQAAKTIKKEDSGNWVTDLKNFSVTALGVAAVINAPQQAAKTIKKEDSGNWVTDLKNFSVTALGVAAVINAPALFDKVGSEVRQALEPETIKGLCNKINDEIRQVSANVGSNVLNGLTTGRIAPEKALGELVDQGLKGYLSTPESLLRTSRLPTGLDELRNAVFGRADGNIYYLSKNERAKDNEANRKDLGSEHLQSGFKQNPVFSDPVKNIKVNVLYTGNEKRMGSISTEHAVTYEPGKPDIRRNIFSDDKGLKTPRGPFDISPKILASGDAQRQSMPSTEHVITAKSNYLTEGTLYIKIKKLPLEVENLYKRYDNRTVNAGSCIVLRRNGSEGEDIRLMYGMDSFNESKSANWTETSIPGRFEPVATYNGSSSRNFSLVGYLLINDRGDILAVHRYLTRVRASVFPRGIPGADVVTLSSPPLYEVFIKFKQSVFSRQRVVYDNFLHLEAVRVNSYNIEHIGPILDRGFTAVTRVTLDITEMTIGGTKTTPNFIQTPNYCHGTVLAQEQTSVSHPQGQVKDPDVNYSLEYALSAGG